MGDLLKIAVATALINNVVLSQFLGLCPFLGVSKKTKTAAGMGAAVVFVMTIASAVTSAIYYFVLTPLSIEYLNTIVKMCYNECSDYFKKIIGGKYEKKNYLD